MKNSNLIYLDCNIKSQKQKWLEIEIALNLTILNKWLLHEITMVNDKYVTIYKIIITVIGVNLGISLLYGGFTVRWSRQKCSIHYIKYQMVVLNLHSYIVSQVAKRYLYIKFDQQRILKIKLSPQNPKPTADPGEGKKNPYKEWSSLL